MSERESEIWDIISALNEGKASEEQRLILQKWLAEDDANQKTFEILSKIRHKKDFPSKEIQDEIFGEVYDKIQKQRNKRKDLIIWYGSVASILIIISLTVALLNRKPAMAIATIETVCPFGSKSKIILPDSSIVHLNSGSALVYPAVFQKNQRIVKLKGEAFFEVKKDINREFIVETGEINIQVFGTKFNVKNYETDKNIETTLVEGSVGILLTGDQNNTPFLLKPNEQGIYERKTQKMSSRYLDAELVAIWKEGKYYFNKESLESIAYKLERAFNKPIVIKNNDLKQQVFSGLFDKNKTLYQLLELMKRNRNFSYVERNDTIFIINN